MNEASLTALLLTLQYASLATAIVFVPCMLIAYVLARFSFPDGGSTDFLPWFLSMEDAMWNCVSCEMWSAYKMKLKGLLTRVVPVLKKDGKFLRNPLVVTDKYVEDGEIVS